MNLQQKGRAKCMCPNGVWYETGVFENCTPACVGGIDGICYPEETPVVKHIIYCMEKVEQLSYYNGYDRATLAYRSFNRTWKKNSNVPHGLLAIGK